MCVCEQLDQGCTRKRGGRESNPRPTDASPASYAVEPFTGMLYLGVGLGVGFSVLVQAVVTTTMRLRFDRYDHSTTYITTVGLPVRGLQRCGLNK